MCLLLLSVVPWCPDAALAQVTMVNGGNHSGALLLTNATNSWAFEVTAGNRIILRLGSVDFTPRLDLFTQQGTYLASAFSDSQTNRDVMLSIQATNTGVYTVEVRSQFPGGLGGYELRLVRIPSLEPAGLFEVHKPGYAEAVRLSPDAKRLATGAGYPDSSLRLWDASSGQMLGKKTGMQVLDMAFSPDGTTLYVCDRQYDAPRVVPVAELLAGP